MKYIYTIVKASHYESQPDEEMKSGKEHNYKCQWFNANTNTKVEAKCFVSSTTMQESKNLQWDIRNSETTVSKAQLKEKGKYFLLKIENKINYGMLVTPLSLINKDNGKQYASLTEKEFDFESKYLVVKLNIGNHWYFKNADKNEDFLIATTKISNNDASNFLSLGYCIIENKEKKCTFLSNNCKILKQNKEIFKTSLEQEALTKNNSEFGSIETIDYYCDERNLQYEHNQLLALHIEAFTL